MLCCTLPSLLVPPRRLIMRLQRRKIIARPANNIIVRTTDIKRPAHHHHHQFLVPNPHRQRRKKEGKKRASLLRELQANSPARLRVLKQAPRRGSPLNQHSVSRVPLLPLLRQIAVVLDRARERVARGPGDGLLELVQRQEADRGRDRDVEALAETYSPRLSARGGGGGVRGNKRAGGIG